MPQNLTPAQPTAVMPQNLCKAFHEDMHLECDLNLYPDGSTDRVPLAQYERHYWTMQQSLTPSEWQSLRTFYMANQGKPFWFYNGRETAPPFSWDGTGQNPVGRYIVTFDGAWSDTYGVGRSQGGTVSLGLREVA